MKWNFEEENDEMGSEIKEQPTNEMIQNESANLSKIESLQWLA